MAVVVQCYHCNNILELDDGFRGGVCRCSECGSLLQVPKGTSKDVAKSRPAAPSAAPSDARPKRPNSSEDTGLSRGQLDPRSPNIQKRPAAPGSSSNASRSGDSSIGSGITSRSPLQRTATATAKGTAKSGPRAALGPSANVPTPKRNIMLIVSIAIIVLLVIIAAVVVIKLATNSPVTPPAPQPSVGGPDVAPTPAPPSQIETSGPNFLGVPLVGKRIVLSIDKGNSAQNSLSYVLAGAINAINQLQPDQQVIIAFWGDDHITTVPENGKWAGKESVGQIKEKLNDIFAAGSSDPQASLKQSLMLDGDQMIVVTAKYGLSSDLAAPVLLVRKSNQRIDAVKIENVDTDSPLQQMATTSNGRFLQLDLGKLQSMTESK